MEKPTITICILSRDIVKAYTMLCLKQLSVDKEINNKFVIEEQWAVGSSDLPKCRSKQLTAWYNNENTKPIDLFMFIDSDQTFLPKDFLKAINLLHEQQANVVCGGYARNNLTPTIETENLRELYSEGVTDISYGSTGFMLISYPIVKKLVKRLKPIFYDNISTCYPFFYERIIKEEHTGCDIWLGEDYSFCHLVSEEKGKIIGFLSESLGHLLTKNCYVQHPKMQDWKEKTIAIMASCTNEKWSPKNIETGIGGSELAIIQLAKRWKEKGYIVIVYCNCGDDVGFYDGVLYQDYLKFQPLDSFNILIIWRNNKLLDTFKLKANKIFLDLHDAECPITDKGIKQTDKFCVKSKFHSEHTISHVPDDKIVIIPNGGCMENNITTEERDPYYLIYSSSYDRGLEYMLRWGWPKIKKAIPQCKLGIYYGWQGFDAETSLRTIEQQHERNKWKESMMKLFKQDGIIEKGRIPQEQLLLEKSKANIHYYTGNFDEIDCISVRESASVGAIPVVSSHMKVFKEKPYCILVDGDPTTRETQQKGADIIINMLRNQQETETYRKNMKVPAETWDMVADKWIELFEE